MFTPVGVAAAGAWHLCVKNLKFDLKCNMVDVSGKIVHKMQAAAVAQLLFIPGSVVSGSALGRYQNHGSGYGRRRRRGIYTAKPPCYFGGGK